MMASLGRWLRARLGPGRHGGADEDPIRIALEEDQACSMLLRIAGARVHCLSGAVWVTREGDPVDHVLEAGEAFVSEGVGRLAIMALRPSCIRVEKRGGTSHLPSRRPASLPLAGRTGSSEGARSDALVRCCGVARGDP
jgi:hypothetical protein